MTVPSISGRIYLRNWKLERLLSASLSCFDKANHHRIIDKSENLDFGAPLFPAVAIAWVTRPEGREGCCQAGPKGRYQEVRPLDF